MRVRVSVCVSFFVCVSADDAYVGTLMSIVCGSSVRMRVLVRGWAAAKTGGEAGIMRCVYTLLTSTKPG